MRLTDAQIEKLEAEVARWPLRERGESPVCVGCWKRPDQLEEYSEEQTGNPDPAKLVVN